MNHNIDFTTEEAQRLTGLLDIAIRAEGLRSAQDALYFANKIGTIVNRDLEAAKKPAESDLEEESDD